MELEELPMDNNILTDEENSEDDEEITATELEKPSLSEENDETTTTDIALAPEIDEDLPCTSNSVTKKLPKKKAEKIDRKWKKRTNVIDIPTYQFDEGPIEEHFVTCKNYTDYFLTVLGSSMIDDIDGYLDAETALIGKA
ncbi:hypothetical protein QE152_g7890 [Popillia japonica]|uniref:PiggyBac transposable element-derived protein domain-containing protein n=1 Tax=Popillia japonica TaxID=7064 RepID=A0AAW1ME28_POPJA